LLAAEPSQRFLIFGEDAENASVGTVDEGFVFVSKRCGVESVDHVLRAHRMKFETEVS
jgi:hypothetical protein